MAPKVHQILATLGYGDAIGNEVLGIHRTLRAAGYESEIIVETADPRLEPLTVDYRDIVNDVGPDDLLIHHFSLGSRSSRTAYALPARMVLIYHNITPPEYFVGVHEHLVRQCYHGRRELTAYRTRCELALGDSEYNRQELDALGFDPTGVLHVVPDFSHLDVTPDSRILDAYDDEWTNILFVGRMVPNKRPDDVIRFFHAFKNSYKPKSRLILAGAYGGFDKYLAQLHTLIATLGVQDVHILGQVTNEALTALYDCADLFLCASEHEGFCVPLVEAFHKRVPVLAFAATAVPATMDGGGVLYAAKDPVRVAALMQSLTGDLALADDVLLAQDAALDRLRARDFEGTLLRFVDQALSGPRRGTPVVAYDFWRQFKMAEELEEIRQYRPGAFKALPVADDATSMADLGAALMIVNQWLAAAHPDDAVGDNARVMRDLFRSWGHTSEIYALTIDSELASEIRPWHDAGARQGDMTILHFAVPSPMSKAFGTLPGVRVLHYHNVTPAHFFAPFDIGVSAFAANGRRELALLADRTDIALGVSEYNRQELVDAGFERTGVLPIVVNTARLTNARPVPALESLLQDGLANILFVGRIAPNKKIEDHIRLAEHYKRYVDIYYRFIFVGNYNALPSYYATVRALIAEYQMLPDRFWFTGPVPDEELAAYYRHAHAYVSLSEHEGFCVPLVEAMAMDVPVLAYDAAAVPETLGGAGVTFAPKDLELAAEMLGALVYDEPLRQQVIAGQRRRLADFSLDSLEPHLKSLLAAVA